MWLRLAAVAAFLLAPAFVRAQATLSLDDAFARVAQTHPDLRLVAARSDVLLAERDAAQLRPPLRAGIELENALGSGNARGLAGSELTLSLAGVLERGGKLDARRTLANARIDALAVERETRRLDLLADTARRYLAVVAAQRAQALAATDAAQRRRAVAAARQRLQAGASPESVLLTAQAALARAELEQARAAQAQSAATRHLAALWGEREPRFVVAGSDPLRLPEIAEAEDIAALLDATPELRRFTDAQRLGEARLRLAQAGSAPDLDWSLGVRRNQADGDVSLVGGVSLALGARGRAQPEIRAAQAELHALEIEREAQGLALRSTLLDAHGRYRLAQLEVARLGDAVLPLLARAEAAAERAYRAGAISYLEWAQLQAERHDAGRQQLEAALAAQRALIELQRLTGQPLLAPAKTEGASP